MLQIMRGVCHAVEAAHRRQLVHRDLKPENIFLADEAAKVLDFGIATFVHPAGDSAPLTATGAVIGTRGYMSPEQARGGAPAPSWDIWALAVVAYEMPCGNRPSGDTSVDDSGPAAVTRASFRLSDRQPALPPSIDALFARAFLLDPSQRPSGALDFMRDLEHVFRGDLEMS
jgi:serine/threonine-protein kinase